MANLGRLRLDQFRLGKGSFDVRGFLVHDGSHCSKSLRQAAFALQVHDSPGEVLFAHQMGHIYYIVALAFFFRLHPSLGLQQAELVLSPDLLHPSGRLEPVRLRRHEAGAGVAPAALVEHPLNIHDRLLPPYTLAKCLYYAPFSTI